MGTCFLTLSANKFRSLYWSRIPDSGSIWRVTMTWHSHDIDPEVTDTTRWWNSVLLFPKSGQRGFRAGMWRGDEKIAWFLSYWSFLYRQMSDFLIECDPNCFRAYSHRASALMLLKQYIDFNWYAQYEYNDPWKCLPGSALMLGVNTSMANNATCESHKVIYQPPR